MKTNDLYFLNKKGVHQISALYFHNAGILCRYVYAVRADVVYVPGPKSRRYFSDAMHFLKTFEIWNYSAIILIVHSHYKK